MREERIEDWRYFCLDYARKSWRAIMNSSVHRGDDYDGGGGGRLARGHTSWELMTCIPREFSLFKSVLCAHIHTHIQQQDREEDEMPLYSLGSLTLLKKTKWKRTYCITPSTVSYKIICTKLAQRFYSFFSWYTDLSSEAAANFLSKWDFLGQFSTQCSVKWPN